MPAYHHLPIAHHQFIRHQYYNQVWTVYQVWLTPALARTGRLPAARHRSATAPAPTPSNNIPTRAVPLTGTGLLSWRARNRRVDARITHVHPNRRHTHTPLTAIICARGAPAGCTARTRTCRDDAYETPTGYFETAVQAQRTRRDVLQEVCAT